MASSESSDARSEASSSASGVAFSGYLEKKTKSNGWTSKYFILRGQYLQLVKDADSLAVISTIDLSGAAVEGPDTEDALETLNFSFRDGTIKLKAPTVALRDAWRRELQKATDDALPPAPLSSPPPPPPSTSSSSSSPTIQRAESLASRLTNSSKRQSARKRRNSSAKLSLEEDPFRVIPTTTVFDDDDASSQEKKKNGRPPFARANTAPPSRSHRETTASDWGEREAQQWMCEVLSVPEPEVGFWRWLRDGVVLCRLAYALRPGCVNLQKMRRSGHRAYDLDNISMFLRACRSDFRLPDSRLFDSIDLYDEKPRSRAAVLASLHALRDAANDNGAEETKPTRRCSMPDTRRSVPCVSPSSQASSPAANDAYRPTHETLPNDESLLRDDSLATVVEEHLPTAQDQLCVYVDEVVTVKLSKGGWCFEDEQEYEGWCLVQKGQEQGLVPKHKLVPGISEEAHFGMGPRSQNCDLDRELAAKMAAKYDTNAEALAQHWIEQVTGHVFRKAFAEELRDGVVLCTLVNCLKENSVPKIYRGDLGYRKMDNITSFLKAAKLLGVRSSDAFNTDDLYNCVDLNQVVQCLFALSAAVQKNSEILPWEGPFLAAPNKTSEASMSALKVIVAVNDYRSRNRRQLDVAETVQKEGVINEAAAYRLAMLRRTKESSPQSVVEVDRSQMEPSFLTVWSSSTKSNLKMEKNERRLVQLFAAKKKRYEMVYLDLSPERKPELRALVPDHHDFPIVTFGTEYHGPFDKLQELEDDGHLDALLADADDGEGYWALPDAWAEQSSLLDGGGVTLLNEVPTL